MASESGLPRQDSAYARDIQEVLNELCQMQQIPRLVTSREELETLEREIRQRTDRLGSLLIGHHLQQALDSATLQALQEQLVRQRPKPLKNDGKGKVLMRTAQGLAVPIWVTYYRRKGQRRAGQRSADRPMEQWPCRRPHQSLEDAEAANVWPCAPRSPQPPLRANPTRGTGTSANPAGAGTGLRRSPGRVAARSRLRR